MPLITPEYTRINMGLHRSRPTYGASGHRWADTVKELGFTDVLDYGCGKGTLARELSFPIKEYDPAVPGKDTLPEMADLVVCTDVLEHIEPDLLGEVLDHIRALTRRMALLVVATRPANKTLPDGRNAHLIIQTRGWWEGEIGKRFYIDEIKEDASQPGEFMVLAR